MGSQSKYDDVLFRVLQSEGQVLPFFNVIFGFLYRRTDFFKIQHDPSENIGFPLGVAQQIVHAAFSKFYKLTMKEEERYQKKLLESSNSSTAECDVPPAVQTVEVETSPDDNLSSNTEKDVQCQPQETNSTSLSVNAKVQNVKVPKPAFTKPISELTQEDFQKHPESYNGAVRNNYSWSQSLRDLDVRIKVASHITSGRMVKVDICHTHLKVSVLDGEDWNNLVNDSLTWRINTEESTWTLVPGDHVHVSLEKVQERWWEALLTSEPQIDIRSIDASQPYDELDEESQAKIDELMYNEQLKRLGKPTVHQTKMQELLREAWDKEGSPFKGQAFDPSIVSIANPEDFPS